MKKSKVLIVLYILFGVIYSSFSQNLPFYVPNNGLVSWLPFNGNANDESGNGNNGTVNGATLTSDRFNNPGLAYRFLTTNTITIPNNSNLQFTDSMSISFWVYPYTSGLTILRKGINYGVDFGNNSNTGLGLYLIFFLPNVYSTTPLQLNTWNHIVVIKDNANMYIYVNNVLNISYSNGSDFSISSSPFTIGSWNNETIDAKIDDIGLWNRPLTEKEVSDLYRSCTPGFSIQPSNVTAYLNNSATFITKSIDTLTSYQWQTNVGLGFQNISDLGQYSGSNNDTLTVSNLTLANNNQLFRCIIDLDGCSDTSDVVTLTVIDNQGISDQIQNKINLYPNPTQNIIHVKVENSLIGSDYVVFDNIGKIVSKGTINSESTIIDLSRFSNGLYLFRLGNDYKNTLKVMKN